MSIGNSTPPNVDHFQRILNIQTQAIKSSSIDDLSKQILPEITELHNTDSALL